MTLLRRLRFLEFWRRRRICRRGHGHEIEKRADGIMNLFPLRRDQGQLGFALVGEPVIGARRSACAPAGKPAFPHQVFQQGIDSSHTRLAGRSPGRGRPDNLQPVHLPLVEKAEYNQFVECEFRVTHTSPSLDLWPTDEALFRSAKIAETGTKIGRRCSFRDLGDPHMATATVPAGVRFASWIALGGLMLGSLVLGLGLIAKGGELAGLRNAITAQFQVVSASSAPSAARLSPPWRKARPSYPLDWQSGRHSPFSYDTPFGDAVREQAQSVAVAPEWTIIYEGHGPARRHGRHKN